MRPQFLLTRHCDGAWLLVCGWLTRINGLILCGVSPPIYGMAYCDAIRTFSVFLKERPVLIIKRHTKYYGK